MRWRYILPVFFLVLTLQVNSQQVVTAVSESKYVNITKDPPKPPYLEIVPNSITFDDQGGNKMIDANEQATIRFKLTNSGSGPGLGLKLLISETNGTPGLEFSREKAIPDVDVGKTVEVNIPVSGKMNTTDGLAKFLFRISEP
ncbi:MAG TPA: hypothetical protein PLM34_03565, partial [Lentimicrobium sp.]|nr:hypothetical protein [Lentimicrobium sp.]